MRIMGTQPSKDLDHTNPGGPEPNWEEEKTTRPQRAMRAEARAGSQASDKTKQQKNYKKAWLKR